MNIISYFKTIIEFKNVDKWRKLFSEKWKNNTSNKQKQEIQKNNTDLRKRN